MERGGKTLMMRFDRFTERAQDAAKLSLLRASGAYTLSVEE